MRNNEEVDRFIRQRSGFSFVGPELALGMKSSTIRSGLEGELVRVYAVEFSNLNVCCQAKVFPIEP